ncbi:MAG TPA: glycine oxidase ThiO [Terriglobales bacterium]
MPKSHDVIIIGGGIIGLSLAIALRKRGATVLVLERGEPGREASHAAAGMLVSCGSETPPQLHQLAEASAAMYSEFAFELEDESGMTVDLRDAGTILLMNAGENTHIYEDLPAEKLIPESLQQLEPNLHGDRLAAAYIKERSVDPRALVEAALKAAKHRSVDIASGSEVKEILIANGKAVGIRTDRADCSAAKIVNCAGAWAAQISALEIPTRPVKGQMLSVVTSNHHLLRHVVRSADVYLVPRSNGRILIGSTVEHAGFDKRTVPATIQKLHTAAVKLLPPLQNARLHEDWAGLRPGTPDNLPILGETSTPGYFAATGHFRDGILLAPITAGVMSQLITNEKPAYDLSAFSPTRF